MRFCPFKGQKFSRNIAKIIMSLSLALFLVPATASAISVDFDYHFVSPGSPPIITVLDDSADITGMPDTVNVIVTSNADPDGISLELLETGNNTGEFKNTGLVLMDNDNLFPQDSTLTISIDVFGCGFDSETVSIFIISFSPQAYDPFGGHTPRDLIELNF